jgi:hypothetical protein
MVSQHSPLKEWLIPESRDMATKTKPRAKTITAPKGQKPGVTKLAAETWVIPCGLLDDWDEPESEYAPYVKRAVLDGYALTYALLGEQDESTGERRASLALSFRPEPAIRNIRLIAMADVLKGLAHVKGEWPGFDAFRKKDNETGPTDDPVTIQRTVRKDKSRFSCTVTSEFFTIAFDYDFTKHLISRFRYSPQPDLKETKTGKRRTYRQRGELPDPDSAPDSEINRQDARFQARISKDTSARVEAFLKATGMQKKDLTEQALAEFLERHGDGIDLDGGEPS